MGCRDTVTVGDTRTLVEVGNGGIGRDANYVYDQGVPSLTWNVAHNLNKFPAVSIVDSGGNLVIGDVLYVDENHITITLAVESGGRAFCN